MVASMELAHVLIALHAAMVDAALNGDLNNVQYTTDPIFHVSIPQSCSNVPQEILTPKNVWADKNDFDVTAKMLAGKFSEQFDKAYGSMVLIRK